MTKFDFKSVGYSLVEQHGGRLQGVCAPLSRYTLHLRKEIEDLECLEEFTFRP